MKKILKKIFQSRSPISNWILVLIVYVSVIMFLTIMDLSKTIEKETYMRIYDFASRSFYTLYNSL